MNITVKHYKLLLILKNIVFVAIIIFFFSCKNKSTEQKEYNSMLASLKYKSYKTLSENSIPPLILLYNTTKHNDEAEIKERVLRLLLGYSWAVGGKPDLAIAENNIIQEIQTKDDIEIYNLSHSIAAIAMYEKGWKILAEKEAIKGSVLFNKMLEPSRLQLDIMVFHIITGTLCIYKDNYQGARFHFAGLNIASQIEWPYLTIDAMTDIKEGNIKKGLKKIKKLSVSKNTPEKVKNILAEGINKAVNDSIDPKIFWSKQTSFELYNEVKNSAIPGMDMITLLLNDLSGKLKIE